MRIKTQRIEDHARVLKLAPGARYHVAILVLCSLLGPVLGSSSEATESKSIQSLSYAGRPPGMYRMVLNKNRTVCLTILQSLNQSYSVPPDHSDLLRNPTLSGEILLSTDLQVKWKRKFIVSDRNHTDVESIIDFVNTDIANNGRISAIYRWGYYSSSRGANELFSVTAPNAKFFEQQFLTLDFIRDLRKDNGSIEIDSKSAPELFRRKDAPVGDALVADLISVTNQRLFIVAGAIRAEQAVTRNRPFAAYVLRYATDASLSLLCEFEGAAHPRRQK